MTRNILFSWFSPQSDLEGTDISSTSPNLLYHQYFYKDKGYQTHYILCSQNEIQATAFQFFLNQLQRSFPKHSIHALYLDIADVMDFQEIVPKVQPYLLEHKEQTIDIFISPGTASMRIAWFIFYQHLGLDIHLLQTRHPNKTNHKKPELLELVFERSQFVSGIIIKEKAYYSPPKAFKDSHDYCYTKSIIPIYEKAAKIAQANIGNVLIFGESGVGKEHLAHYIHQQSARKNKPFLSMNCAAFHDELLESRLFGHKKGAFTSAHDNHKGLFEEADGGTVFLDEIGDISPYMQQVLLRTLQGKEQEITPIGLPPKHVQVRIVAATNKNLLELCSEGKFRWDLYYRLAVAELELPSLAQRSQQERKQLILFLMEQKQKMFKAKPLQLSKEVEKELLHYPFRGNIRELENLIEHFYITCSNLVNIEDLPNRFWAQRNHSSSQNLQKLEDVEKWHIQRMLQLHQHNTKRTADALGISINTLKRKKESYQLE